MAAEVDFVLIAVKWQREDKSPEAQKEASNRLWLGKIEWVGQTDLRQSLAERWLCASDFYKSCMDPGCLLVPDLLPLSHSQPLASSESRFRLLTYLSAIFPPLLEHTQTHIPTHRQGHVS